MEKKKKRNPKLRLNKDSLRPVSDAALRSVVGGSGPRGGQCDSSEEPSYSCHATCGASCPATCAGPGCGY